MIHFDPAYFEAAATGIVAAETGVSMLSKKNAAATPTVNLTVNGITAQEWWIGIAILAAAFLVGALIIHHALGS
jgi:hypothetical protein